MPNHAEATEPLFDTSEYEGHLDSDRRVVEQGLHDERFPWRTVHSLSEEFNIPAFRIQSVLDEQVADKENGFARLTPFTSHDGEAIYTARERPIDLKERVQAAREFITRGL